MSAPLIDALRETGHARVTLWHLACLESFLAAMEQKDQPRLRRYGEDNGRALTNHAAARLRLAYDLCFVGVHHSHLAAQWDDGEWTALDPVRR